MAIDCSSLESQVSEIGARLFQCVKEERDVLQEEWRAKEKLSDLKNRRQQLSGAIDSLGQLIKQYESVITSAEQARDSRTAEFRDGVKDLTNQRRGFDRELEAAPDDAARDQIRNRIGMVDLAVEQHHEGIRQLSSVADTTIDPLRNAIQTVSDEVHGNARQLQQMDADLPNVEREAMAASDKARHAHERLEHLRRESDDKARELRECYDRKRAAETRVTPPSDGEFLKR